MSVEAFKYLTRVYGISATGYDSWHVFIPTLSLDISDRGDVTIMKTPYGSLKRNLVNDAYFRKCNREGEKFDQDELRRLEDEADLNAREKLLIGEDDLKILQTIYQEQIEIAELEKKLQAQKKSLESRTSALFQKLLEGPSIIVPEGFYEGQKYQVTTNLSKSVWHIFIKTLELDISEEGDVSRPSMPYLSQPPAVVRKQFMLGGINLEQKANKQSKEPILIREELAKEIESLAQEKTRTGANRSAIQERIKGLWIIIIGQGSFAPQSQ